MRSSYTPLMQTKYFSPAFNSAIFDGPMRIYFAQLHESFALKVYFLVQQKMMSTGTQNQEVATEFKNRLVSSRTNVLIMVYASEESFGYSFAQKSSNAVWSYEELQGDLVVGLERPLEDHELPEFIEDLKFQIQSHLARLKPALEPSRESVL